MTQDETVAVGTDAPSGTRPDGEQGNGVAVAFGRQLKLLRVRAGLDRAEFGQRMGYAAQSVASFEQGRRIPQPAFVDKADRLLEAGGLLVALKEELARSQYPAFFRDMARLEAEAVELCAYDTHMIKGLLQTEEYTRAVLAMRRPLLDEETIEQRVAARLARQEIFSRWPAPLISFVMEEPILRRPLGGKDVLRGQLERLLHFGRFRNVEIQMMPLDRDDNAGVDGAFTVVTRRDGEKFVYMEAQGRSNLLTDRDETRLAAARYGIIRSQALSPGETLRFIEKLLGEL
ncbi:helix-turn-helix transcriptional regulator [Streptomyces clavifer]|uniref:Transcriptional regulator with XRE-family HTH domain n=1 Tax=Streptomyces clavifer TaxID=68188 RepID=A0ABS4V2F1_9ACTN|nr:MULTISPECIES: helix-turn-helix transcriptional regulator [Streptomyces]KQX93147.1 DNA-binding protein [Streptomyces sp. Root1319]KQZ17494.1 DNA-binding protein [Streptomyces sp. Root55]MBP2357909.1 transcriptional regulator with XRE-family HTH domain [Streptomyces clavifer]MDX2742419.1 helix-turn-helix transcriptional regulator [Streptomyces sp. NRRL_B-2557]MDX3063506.1 helix-turn-helix transcriptional regulator [Streptomyces sp. ND04-05B]